MTDVMPVNGSCAYGALAAEYYNAQLHPTCANFRWASDRLLNRLMPRSPGRLLCDVGAGDSALAGWLERNMLPIQGLLLVDDSADMLAHSARWTRAGAVAMLANASALPLRSHSANLLVASLADPFDDLAWWLEVDRVLIDGGNALVTLPAPGWVAHFRIAAGEPVRSARFLTRAGLCIDVPSYVRPRAQEIELIERAGLRLVAEEQITRGEIPPPISPKLNMLQPDDAVVVAYMVTH